MSAPRVFLVDDHQMFRAGVRAELGDAVEVLGEAADVESAVQGIRATDPEVVLLDVQIHAISQGFGHGRVHLWSEDQTLLAIASQSAIVRYWK